MSEKIVFIAYSFVVFVELTNGHITMQCCRQGYVFREFRDLKKMLLPLLELPLWGSSNKVQLHVFLFFFMWVGGRQGEGV